MNSEIIDEEMITAKPKTAIVSSIDF